MAWFATAVAIIALWAVSRVFLHFHFWWWLFIVVGIVAVYFVGRRLTSRWQRARKDVQG